MIAIGMIKMSRNAVVTRFSCCGVVDRQARRIRRPGDDPDGGDPGGGRTAEPVAAVVEVAVVASWTSVMVSSASNAHPRAHRRP